MKRDIEYIAIHCSAGYGTVESIKNFWKNILKWKSVGYHIITITGNYGASTLTAGERAIATGKGWIISG